MGRMLVKQRPAGSRAISARPRRRSANIRLAAIDVGTNSIHMVIAQVETDGGISTLWRYKEMVGLGRLTFPSRRLSIDAMDRAIGTLRRFVQLAQRRGVEKIIAVATSAVREAENGGDLIERIRAELGLILKIVSAREEARLIYLGVWHAAALSDMPRGKKALIVDIGGGSVEFIVADSRRPVMLESLKLGAARMTAEFVKSDPISQKNLQALRQHYEKQLLPIVQAIKTLGVKRYIGTSGTLENVAAMCCGVKDATENPDGNARQKPPGIIGVIEAQSLRQLAGQIVQSRRADRDGFDGLDEKRQDQIVAGLVLVQELFTRLRIGRMELCSAAMREGILIDYIARHLPDLAVRRELPDPQRRSVFDLGRRCDWRPQHSEHVTRLALDLFDVLRPIHGLNKTDRLLIEYGCLLHDIGWHIGPSGHHKHSMYLILNGNLQGFTAEEISIIANVARYHRKSAPKPEHAEYQQLSAHGRQVVQVGAALLRLADGLDRSHGQAVRRITVKRPRAGNKVVGIQVHGRGDIELELWAARRAADFFKAVLGYEPRVEKAGT